MQTLLIGVDGALGIKETNTMKILSRNLGLKIETQYGPHRVVIMGVDGDTGVSASDVEVLLTPTYRYSQLRSKQTIFSEAGRMQQRVLLSKLSYGQYESPGAYLDSGALPTGKRFIAKPLFSARSMGQIVFDTTTQTAESWTKFFADCRGNLGHIEKYGKEWETIPESIRSLYGFGTRDAALYLHAQKHGATYFPGTQHRENESIEQMRSSMYEEIVPDVQNEYRLIFVADKLMVAYERTLVSRELEHGIIQRPFCGQESLDTRRFFIHELDALMPGLKQFVKALHAEHQHPTWSLDLFSTARNTWGAFEFSPEYSLVDLTSKEQHDIYTELVETWIRMSRS